MCVSLIPCGPGVGSKWGCIGPIEPMACCRTTTAGSTARAAKYSCYPIEYIFRLDRDDIDTAVLGSTFLQRKDAQLGISTIDGAPYDLFSMGKRHLPVIFSMDDEQRASNSREHALERATLQGCYSIRD
jgi:hypothetical protein